MQNKIVKFKKKSKTLDLYIYIGKVANKKGLWLYKNSETAEIAVVVGDMVYKCDNHQYMIPETSVTLTRDGDNQKHELLLELMRIMDNDEFPEDAECFRCGEKAATTFGLNADGNEPHYFCRSCDIKLNELVLKFAGFDNVAEKIEAYKKLVEEE